MFRCRNNVLRLANSRQTRELLGQKERENVLVVWQCDSAVLGSAQTAQGLSSWGT